MRDFPGKQQDLFQQVGEPAAEPVDLNVGMELLGALTFSLREAKQRGLSRERIVDRMNQLLPEHERKVTKRQLDSWCALSCEDKRFPAELLPAFCAAVGSNYPLYVLARSLGLELADAREQMATQLGENLIQTARLSREKRELQQRLGN